MLHIQCKKIGIDGCQIAKKDNCIINVVNSNGRFSYLKLKDKIHFVMDPRYDFLVLKVEFQGWNATHMHFCPNEKNARKWNIFRTSSPRSSPNGMASPSL